MNDPSPRPVSSQIPPAVVLRLGERLDWSTPPRRPAEILEGDRRILSPVSSMVPEEISGRRKVVGSAHETLESGESLSQFAALIASPSSNK